MELVSKPDHDHMVFSRLSQEQFLVELKVLEYNTQTNHKPLISAEPQQIGEALRGFSELILRTQSTGVFLTAFSTQTMDMLSTRQKLKETLLIGAAYIALPTADVYSDGAFILKLALGTTHHPSCESEVCRWNSVWNDWSWELSTNETCLATIPDKQLYLDRFPAWTTMMAIPFLANYMMTWFLWSQIATRKHLSWLACLLNVFPQMRAMGIIFEIWRNPRRGLIEKRKFERELTETEVFLESVPATFVMTYIIGRLIANDTPRVRRALRGEVGSWSHILFLTTYLTSLFSASWGMAKVLKIGPCKVLKEEGPLNGFLTLRFFLIFPACLFVLFSKTMLLLTYVSGKSPLTFIHFSILTFTLSTLPGFIIACFSTWHPGGLKTFLNHPSFLLLSTFTFFSFRSNSKKYCAKHGSSQMDTELCFSLRATLVNIVFSFLGMFFYSSLDEPSRFSFSVNSLRDLPGALTLGSFVLGVLFTLIFLATAFSSNYTLSSCGSCVNQIVPISDVLHAEMKSS